MTLFGAWVNEETFFHAKEYFFWITLGIPFYMFGQALNPMIRSDGSPNFAMASTLAVWYLCHMKAVRLERESFRLHSQLAKKYLPLGVCSFLSQISLVMAMAAIQNMTLRCGALDPIFGQTQYAQIPMAVLGIVMKFFQIVISVSVGLAAGYIPVVGYNIGPGLRLHRNLHGAGGALRCGACSAAPAAVRTGRGAVLHAGL